MVIVALRVAGKLGTRRISSQQLQKQRLAAGIRRERLEAALLRAGLDVENGEGQVVAVDTTALQCLAGIRMRQQVGVDRLLTTDETLTDEILLQFARLGGEGLRDAANAAVVQRGEAAEKQLPLFQVALPDALVLNGEQQATLVSDTELAQQYRTQQGERIDTGERRLGTGQGGQPGCKDLVVGQRGEHDALVLAA